MATSYPTDIQDQATETLSGRKKITPPVGDLRDLKQDDMTADLAAVQPLLTQIAELDAAAYAIKAARAAALAGEEETAGRIECQWQREQLPEAIRTLVLDDQRLRNDLCWSVFDC